MKEITTIALVVLTLSLKSQISLYGGLGNDFNGKDIYQVATIGVGYKELHFNAIYAHGPSNVFAGQLSLISRQYNSKVYVGASLYGGYHQQQWGISPTIQLQYKIKDSIMIASDATMFNSKPLIRVRCLFGSFFSRS